MEDPNVDGWDERETEEFIDYVSSREDRDWNQIASVFPNKTPKQCESWWEFLTSFEALLQEHGITQSRKRPRGEVPINDELGKKRQRRLANQIDRKYKCPIPECPRAYGTEGALKCHFKNKHKDQNYSPPASRSTTAVPAQPTPIRPTPMLVPTRPFGIISPPVFPNGLDISTNAILAQVAQQVPDIYSNQGLHASMAGLSPSMLNQNMLKAALMNPLLFGPVEYDEKNIKMSVTDSQASSGANTETKEEDTQIDKSREIPLDHNGQAYDVGMALDLSHLGLLPSGAFRHLDFGALNPHTMPYPTLDQSNPQGSNQFIPREQLSGYPGVENQYIKEYGEVDEEPYKLLAQLNQALRPTTDPSPIVQ